MPTIPAQTFEGFYIPETIFHDGDFEITNGRYQERIYNRHSEGALYSCSGTQTTSYPRGWAVAASSESFTVKSADGNTFNPSTYTLDNKTVYYYFYYAGSYFPSEYPVTITPPIDNYYGTETVHERLLAWLMVYGGYAGFTVTYELEHCSGSVDNPTRISPDAVITNAHFDADPGFYFSRSNTIIYGTGLGPEGGVVFTFDTTTGDMRIGVVTSDITIKVVCTTDPYGPGGNSGTGGGGGTFDLDSDVIGIPPIPTLSFASTGFTRIYNPSLSELNALANYLWTDQTFLDTVINHLKQLLENPMDAVISLSLLPCPIPNGTPEAVKVMYINTGVSMAPATTQFVDVDCGTYSLEEFYGSALDYNPYTKVHCYLPYIGQVTLDTDEVMGKTLNVVYRIDIVTGMCAAMILVDQNVLYQFSGHCSINMPINSADFSGYIGAAMTAGKMVAGVVAGASGNIPLAAELIGAPAPHSSTSETVEKTTERNPKTGRQVTAGTTSRTTTRNTPGASFGEMSRKAAANTVGAVMGSKLTVEHAGGFTGNSGYLAVRRPYLIIERPRMCNPEEYGKYNGRPSMIYMNLGECTGYTEVQSVQLENIPATNPELAELSELLKSGVLF